MVLRDEHSLAHLSFSPLYPDQRLLEEGFMITTDSIKSKELDQADFNFEVYFMELASGNEVELAESIGSL